MYNPRALADLELEAILDQLETRPRPRKLRRGGKSYAPERPVSSRSAAEAIHPYVEWLQEWCAELDREHFPFRHPLAPLHDQLIAFLLAGDAKGSAKYLRRHAELLDDALGDRPVPAELLAAPATPRVAP